METQECPDSRAQGGGLQEGFDGSCLSGRRRRPHRKKEVWGAKCGSNHFLLTSTIALENITPLYRQELLKVTLLARFESSFFVCLFLF